MMRVMEEVKKNSEINGGPPTSSLPKPLNNDDEPESVAYRNFKSRPPILTSDLYGVGTLTNNQAASSLTSTATTSSTSSATRYATQLEVEDSAFAWLHGRKGKKTFGLLRTSLGDMHIEMDSDIAPRTVANVVMLANDGYYDGCLFHRVIAGFMSQTGDPTGTGKGGRNCWGSEGMEEEFDSRLEHVKYSVSMANAGVGTGRSQFFVCSKDARHLDGKHTVFGRIVKGMEVVDEINGVRTRRDRPVENVVVNSFTVHVDRVSEDFDEVYKRKEERERGEREKARRLERVKEEARERKRKEEGEGEEEEGGGQVGKYMKVGGGGAGGGGAGGGVGGGGGTELIQGDIGGQPKKKKKKTSGGFENFSGW